MKYNNVPLRYHCELCHITDIANNGKSFESFHSRTPERGLELRMGDVLGYKHSPRSTCHDIFLVECASTCDERHYRQYGGEIFYSFMLQDEQSRIRPVQFSISRHQYRRLCELTQPEYDAFMQRLQKNKLHYQMIMQGLERGGEKIHRGRIRT